MTSHLSLLVTSHLSLLVQDVLAFMYASEGRGVWALQEFLSHLALAIGSEVRRSRIGPCEILHTVRQMRM